MKKIITLILVLALVAALVVSFAACNSEDLKDAEEQKIEGLEAEYLELEDFTGLVVPSTFKIGMICLHDETSTYDKNFIDAAKAAVKALGMQESQLKIKVNVDENEACYDAAVELIEDEQCNIIFADSFGHEPYMINAAREYPNVQFCHATGTKAHTENLANYHNAFASIYEGRYLAGVAAGMKLKEINEGKSVKNYKIGYVGAFPYAEVKSGYTSFYLGVKSICPDATMEVKFTGSWFDPVAEGNVANTLIENGCALISQHADSMGAPSACEAAGIPNVSYNGSTIEACPETFLVSSRIDWEPYVKHIIKCYVNNTAIETDWVGTIKNGAVKLTDLNAGVVAAGTAEKIVEVRRQIVKGELKVFDTSKFTVGGSKLNTYSADVDDFGDYVGETEVIKNGQFEESKYRSAPYFDIDIDGITILG